MKKLNVLFIAFLIFATASIYSVSGLIVSLAILASWTILKKQENTQLVEDLTMAIDQYNRGQEHYEEAVKLVKDVMEKHNEANAKSNAKIAALEEQLQNIKVGQSLKFGGGK